jgi:alpha-beta hydrolase superfamily lysophospholipase
MGIVLAGNDHPGHGESAASPEDFGYFAKDGGVELAVEGLAEMSRILLERYEGKPLILLGHSMGSFLCRIYLTKYAENLAGAIVMGTAGAGAPTGAGISLASLIAFFRGDRHRSKLLRTIQQSGYLKRCGKNPDRCDWLTRDRAIVEAYNNDKFCNYIFTVSGYRDLFRMIRDSNSDEWFDEYPKELPTLIMSGDMDPVGNYGKGPDYVYKHLLISGCKSVILKSYEGARHELFNETEECRREVFSDMINWLEGIR